MVKANKRSSQHQQTSKSASTIYTILSSRIQNSKSNSNSTNAIVSKQQQYNDTTRIDFIQSLERLGYCIDTLKEIRILLPTAKTTNDNNNSIATTISNSNSTLSNAIMSIEKDITTVKETAHLYEDVLHMERRQLLLQLHQNTNTNKALNMNDDASLSHTVIQKQYLKQIHVEQDICSKIVSSSFFSNLYHVIENVVSSTEKKEEDAASDGDGSALLYNWSNMIRNCSFIHPLLLLQLQTRQTPTTTLRPSSFTPTPIPTSNTPSSQKSQSITNVCTSTASNNVQEMLQEYYKTSIMKQPFQSTFVLVSGPSRYGKTHLCNSIQQQQHANNVTVIRPILPIDIIGKTVGASEALLTSYFYYARVAASSSVGKKCILLLDDMDHIVGGMSEIASGTSSSKDNSSLDSHWRIRIRATFLKLLDSLQEVSTTAEESGHLLVICTCTSTVIQDDITSRFHKVCTLQQPPNEKEREVIIRSCLLLRLDTNHEDDEEMKTLVSDTIHMSMGRSPSEISYCCRQTILSLSSSSSLTTTNNNTNTNHTIRINKQRLAKLKEYMIQSTPSQSIIKSNNLDQFASLRIYTSKHLNPQNDANEFPLYGMNAQEAWKKIKSLIITPLCQSNDLDTLLHHHSTTSKKNNSKKSVCGGVLLTGPPGCGKTSISFHCAKEACKILPTLKLLVVSCTSLIHKELGKSEQTIARIFSAARSSNTPCILLLDNIDTISQIRGNDTTSEGTMDRVLSTLLMEMDGIEEDHKGSNIAVIGITHESKWIDNALKRPGRLEQTITLDYPSKEARMDITRHELENNTSIPIHFSMDNYFLPKSNEELIEYVGLHTYKQSASDVIAICKNAVILSIRSYIATNHNGTRLLDDDNDGNSHEENSITTAGLLKNILLEPLHFKQALKI